MKNETAGVSIVNASAGTGKTYSLTDDIAYRLANGMAPEALMATTFTNKAAEELRERTRRVLLERGLYDEALRIFDGFIGTVNSICGRLLKEYAIYAGLSPALDVIPEGEGGEAFRMAASSAIESFAPAIEPAARRLGRDGGGSGFQKRQDWRDDVRDIAEKARYNLIGPERLKECAEVSLQSLMRLSDTFDSSSSAPDSRDKTTPTTGVLIDETLDRAVEAAIASLEEIDSPKKKTASALETLKKFREARRRFARGGPDVT
ncbi:MAG: UvrD-helicase domain-containing protein, partial [Synergistaceae bacterium]|nr:UvrD-helicase domain-containing protein [Synergistaceae bacterium]